MSSSDNNGSSWVGPQTERLVRDTDQSKDMTAQGATAKLPETVLTAKDFFLDYFMCRNGRCTTKENFGFCPEFPVAVKEHLKSYRKRKPLGQCPCLKTYSVCTLKSDLETAMKLERNFPAEIREQSTKVGVGEWFNAKGDWSDAVVSYYMEDSGRIRLSRLRFLSSRRQREGWSFEFFREDMLEWSSS